MGIDRRALVTRHTIRRTQTDPQAPIQLGNGELGLSVDCTGLQTFPELHPSEGRDPDNVGTLLGTQSQWGWHTIPRDPEPELSSAVRMFDTPRGEVPYVDLSAKTSASGPEKGTEDELWLRENPHRLMLGHIGLAPSAAGLEDMTPEDLTVEHQELDLWTGIAHSQFTVGATGFDVRTAVHPDQDTVAWSIASNSIHPLAVTLNFPYGSGAWGNASDWVDEGHQTTVEITQDPGRLIIRRTVDETQYVLEINSDQPITAHHVEPHTILLGLQQGTKPQTWSLSVGFRAEHPVDQARQTHGTSAPWPDATPEVFEASARWWEHHWSTGGAMSFARSTDPRAAELERRVVLSQYLTVINCTGSTPPQETGLMVNSWRGKFHLEMHWWHSAHFALWGRPHLLEKSLGWYRSALPGAKQTAQDQGVTGARWQKQVGPGGQETPSDIGPFLLWQQPHLIYFAELLRQASGMEVACQYADLVFETAEFMASHPVRDGESLSLGSPLIPAQECYGDLKAQLKDPTFELAYWYWGLDVAIAWREKLGLAPEPSWIETRDLLVRPALRDGVYPAVRAPILDRRRDHPSVLAALGFTPETPLIEKDSMEATLLSVLQDWDWESTWGWDYPMIAMTATRLGRPDLAIDALLMPAGKNTYLSNGHNWQNEGLPLYLPGNGGLLAAIALMVAGWEDSPDYPGLPPGFKVDYEGISLSPR